WDITGVKARKRADLPVGGLLEGIAFIPDGKRLACVCRDTSAESALRVLNLGETAPREWVRGPDKLRCGAISPDGNTLAFGGKDNTVQLWDLARQKPEVSATLKEHTQAVSSVVFAPDGQTLATSDLGGQVIWWDAYSGKKKLAWHLPGDGNNASRLTFA